MIVRVSIVLGLCAACGPREAELVTTAPPSWPPHLHEHPRIEGIPCPYGKEKDWQTDKKSNEASSKSRENVGRLGEDAKARVIYRRGHGSDDQQ